MNGRSGPRSPNSAHGSEWSGVSQYQYSEHPPPYSPNLSHNRGNLITPPISGSSNGTQPRMSSGINSRPGGPSPPSSVARSSYGTTLSTSETQRRKTLQMEEKLSQHYSILKRFLAHSLRDEKGNPKPNRARDKLLRLSAVQFQELSTDVYDELLRRQSASGQQRNGPGQVPEFLLPKENFHPKRNQARQKLATLPPPRFQDLATDVFFELERRFPMFAGRDLSRVGSPAVSQYGAPPSRVGTPNGFRQNHGPRNASLGSQVMAGLGIPGVDGANDSYGRPTAKTSQSNTIIPNKSTMVEDDDDDGSDVYGSKRDTSYTTRSGVGSEKDRKIAEFETQVGEFENRVGDLQAKVKEQEEQLHDKDSELAELHGSHSEQMSVRTKSLSFSVRDVEPNFSQMVDTERQKFSNLQSDLENKLTQARNLNNNLQSELDKLQNSHAETERSLRSQIDLVTSEASGGGEWKARFENLDKEHQDLRTQFLRQEKITSEVKQEATGWLNQMKVLSERNGPSYEREEKMVHQIHSLEKELQEWKTRYAKSKTQLRTLRASSTADILKSPDAGGAVKDFIAPDGLIKDIHVTKFQVAIDELLQSARGSELDAVLGRVKSVIIAVRNITLDVGDTQSGKDEATQQRHKQKAKLSATSNNLITAARNYTMAKGLSPVSLLDAAASHVAAAVIELVHLIKIRQTPAEQLDDDDDNSIIADSPADYYGISHLRESAGGDSVYSSLSSPRRSQVPSSLNKVFKPQPNGTTNGGPYPSRPNPPQGVDKSFNRTIDDLKVMIVQS